MADQRPAVFIGSSNEGIQVAKEIESHLKEYAAVRVWKNDFFKLGGGILERLTDQLDSFDFAIFVLSPDDTIEVRGQSYSSPRDNVLFELGLFMGRLGRGRTFIVHEEGVDLKLPSDLAGIITSPYRLSSDRSDDDISEALSAACWPIIKAIRALKFRDNHRNTSLPSDLRLYSYQCPESEKFAKRQGMFAKCASRSTTAKYLVLRGRDILSSEGEIAAVSRDAAPLLSIQLLMVDFDSLSIEKFREIRQTMDLAWDEDLEAERRLAGDRLAFAKDLSRRKSGFKYRLLPSDMVPEIKLRIYNHSAFFTFYRRNVGFSAEVQNRPVFCVEDQDPSKYDPSPLRVTLERLFDELWDLSKRPS